MMKKTALGNLVVSISLVYDTHYKYDELFFVLMKQSLGEKP